MSQVALAPVQVPFPVEVPYRVTPAPRPLGDAPHVLLDDAWPDAVTRRLERLGEEPDAVLVRDPVGHDDAGLLAALEAAFRLLPSGALERLGLTVRAGGHVVAAGDSACPAATEAVLTRSGWQRVVVAWWLACSDDLVVLRRSGPGSLRAELLAVAFPSGWSPRERAGASLPELHGPIPDNGRLQRAAPALSEALLTKGPYLQHVWGLDRSARLDHDTGSSYDEEDTGSSYDEGPADWHLRVERQTTLPLPELGRALFTIRPYLVPLAALTAGQRSTLAQAVAGMSPAARAYKGVTPELLELLGA